MRPSSTDGWAEAYIAKVGEGNSRDILPLQGADVIAWVANRPRSHGDRQDWYQALFQRDPRGFKHYDYDALMAEYEHPTTDA